MKKILIATTLSILTTLSAQAAFICDYNYQAQGQEIQSTLQLEKSKGKELLTMRSQSGELITALQVSTITKTRIGSIVHFYMAAEGTKAEGQLVLPRILPGPGQIVWEGTGAEQVSCRNRK